jgi:hypothetical protein
VSLAVDRARAGHRQRRITRRRHACHRVKKTWTLIRHACELGLADALAAVALVVAMIEPTFGRLSVTSARRSLRLGTCRHLARRATEPLSAIAGSTDTEHQQAPATPLESKLLVVHRLLPRRRKTCSGRRWRASCAQSRRPSAEGLGLQSGALDLFGVLAGRDRNGEIFGAATFLPTGSTARTRRNHAAINSRL